MPAIRITVISAVLRQISATTTSTTIRNWWFGSSQMYGWLISPRSWSTVFR